MCIHGLFGPVKFQNFPGHTVESCFILDGKVIVTTDHEKVTIVPGDFIVFPKGLSCRWRVLKTIRKHYSFE